MAGTWIFGIVALFIVLFSSFIAYSISYTKAFKTKNEILNYIEQNEGFTMAKDVDEKIPIDRLTNEQMERSTATDVKAYLLIQSMGYNTAAATCDQYGTEQHGGYCVARICYKDSKSKSNAQVVYKVTTFIKIDLPVVNINLRLPISGETKAIYYENKISETYGCWTSTDLD